MKCCNGNCNQGRWCERHKENAQKRVDKIDRIMYTVVLNYNIVEIAVVGVIAILLGTL